MIDPTFGIGRRSVTQRVVDNSLVEVDILGTEIPDEVQVNERGEMTIAINNSATFIGDSDPDACGGLFSGDKGYEIRAVPVTGGSDLGGDSDTVCVPATGSATVTIQSDFVDPDDRSLGVILRGANSNNELGSYTESIDVIDSDSGGTTISDLLIFGPDQLDALEEGTWNVSPPDGATAEWDMGDGTTLTGTEVSYTYGIGGTYTITVTATDSNGNVVGEGSRQIEVAESLPDINVSIAGPDQPTVDEPATYSIQGDSLTSDTFAEWDMGDGTSLSGASVTHTYTETGPFQIDLEIVTSEGERVDAVSDFIDVQPQETAADGTSGGSDSTDDSGGSTDDGGGTDTNLDISAPSTAATGEIVEFQVTGGSVMEIAFYRWDMGDGTTTNGESPIKSYSSGGTYTVTVEGVGYDDQVVDTATQQIEITGGDGSTDDGSTGDGTGDDGSTTVPDSGEIEQNLSAGNCRPDSTPVRPDSLMTLQIDITNSNSFTVTGTVEIDVGGERAGSAGFTLNAGESVTEGVSMVAPAVAGDYEIEYQFADLAQV